MGILFQVGRRKCFAQGFLFKLVVVEVYVVLEELVSSVDYKFLLGPVVSSSRN